ncbi:MAG: RelA/SpoT domain-containing protein [Asticcacaulis sp.]
MSRQLVNACVAEYSRSSDRLIKLVQFVVQKLETELKKHQIMARVSGRVKTRTSLENKLETWVENPEKAARLQRASDIFNVVGDLAAVRVMTYVEDDRKTVAEIVMKLFDTPNHIDKFGFELKENSKRIKESPNNYYRATHMQIALRAEDCVGPNENLKSDHCELQITSMLAHVWNEIEHDIGYKGDGDELSPAEQSALDSLGMLTKTGDNIIVSLIGAHKSRHSQKATKARRNSEYFQDADALGDFLQRHFGEKIANKKTYFGTDRHSLFDALRYLNLHHPEKVAVIFKPKLMEEAITTTMRALREFENSSQTARQRFNKDSADVALVVLFGQYGEKLAKEPYAKSGMKPRHLALAIRYQAWLEHVRAKARGRH